jgi:DNA invertase Pin-like site-specific DNA recombinase
MKTAIAYTSDIILGRTGEVISRESQKELIKKFAESNDIDIVAWFEDEMYNEDLFSRPGIQEMLAHTGSDTLLVERVWSLSRKSTVLESFYQELEKKSLKLEATTTLWDVISQMARRHFDKTIPAPQAGAAETAKQVGAVKVAKPKKLHFVFRPVTNEAE